MSSVTRFLKQVPAGLNYYSLPTAYTSLYEFVPSSSNTVGNYPPGAMVAAGNSTTLAAYLQTTGMPYAGGSLQSGFVMRDMGKTILAPVGSASGNKGYFRQVQLIAPAALNASQGFNGGSAGSNFGVLGAANTPDAYTDYLSFFIPVGINGVNYGPIAVNAYPLAAGQM